jgi:hypothetical protein
MPGMYVRPWFLLPYMLDSVFLMVIAFHLPEFV